VQRNERVTESRTATDDVSTTRDTVSASRTAIMTFFVPATAGSMRSRCGSKTFVQNGEAVWKTTLHCNRKQPEFRNHACNHN